MNSEIFHHHILSMNTRLDMVVCIDDQQIKNKIIPQIETLAFNLEKTLSRFDTTSEVFTINHLAPEAPVKISHELLLLIQRCINYNIQTWNHFSIFMLPLLEIWKTQKKEACFEIPAQELIASALEKTKAENIIINMEDSSLFYKIKGVGIDFGGIGKGILLDKIKEITEAFKIKNTFFCFGESSILTLGKHPHGDAWLIDVHNIFTKVKLFDFKVNDAFISISGTSIQRISEHHESYSHIIHPHTGIPYKGYKTVYVIASSGEISEVASTAIFLAKNDELNSIFHTFEIEKAYIITYDENKTAHVTELTK